MRKITLFAVACFSLHFSLAENNSPILFSCQAYLIVQPGVNIAASRAIQKKRPLKERLLLKWYNKKIQNAVSEEKEKKRVNLLGYLSLGLSVLAPLLLISLYSITAYGVVQVLSVFALLLLPASVILGIISLRKRKKLADKTGTSKIPAMIGILISSALVLLFLIILISFSVNGYGFNFY